MAKLGQSKRRRPAQVRAYLSLGRTTDWWTYKIAPPLAAFYATALLAGGTLWASAAGLGMLLVALVPGAVFVSVLNDLTDREDDAKAGKQNRQEGGGRRGPLLMLTASLVIGIALCWIWRDDPILVAVFVSAWVLFALYSAPLFRWKKRGFLSVICDAIGANTVPVLLAGLLCARALNESLPPEWLAALAFWSFGFGIRGILWHQIGDLECDRSVGAKTLPGRFGVASIAKFVRYVVLPMELFALGCLIWQLPNQEALVCVIALGIYLLFLHERLTRFDMIVTLVRPLPRSTILMQEYYDHFLPVGLLLAAFIRYPPDGAFLVAHVFLFPQRWNQIFKEVQRLRDPQFVRRWLWNRPKNENEQ